jgi:hypothetical protein
LPEGYLARTGKRSYVVLAEANGKTEHSFLPDVSRHQAVATPDEGREGNPTPTVETEPVELLAFIEKEFEESFIDIFELKPEPRLVTSIEVLSPSNKRRRSRGWKKYLRKRQRCCWARPTWWRSTPRGGERMPMLDPWPNSPYTLLVAREERAPRCKVWLAFFDRPLPAIPVPLSRPTPDLTLALQPLIDAIYERGRYREDIDYVQPLTPPLSEEQAAWLQQRLRGEATPGEPRSVQAFTTMSLWPRDHFYH